MSGLDNSTILQGLAALGAGLRVGRDVELLLVGGAAGMLINILPAHWTTADVDIINCRLPQDRDVVLDAAADVAKQLSLPADWLNDWSGLYA